MHAHESDAVSYPASAEGLIIRLLCPGPERSGSTWLFNAIRLLCHDAQQPLDPFWISHLTDSLLQDRSAGTSLPYLHLPLPRLAVSPCAMATKPCPILMYSYCGPTLKLLATRFGLYHWMYSGLRAGENAGSVHVPHILVKTHAWSDDWDPESATHIFLTHRDLRGVLASYQRVGWAFDITQAYVTDHMRWRVSCSAPSPLCGLSLPCKRCDVRSIHQQLPSAVVAQAYIP